MGDSTSLRSNAEILVGRDSDSDSHDSKTQAEIVLQATPGPFSQSLDMAGVQFDSRSQAFLMVSGAAFFNAVSGGP